MMATLVANWERCSLMLEKTCRAHGIRYYHILQPNQYVPGSKPMGEEEKKVALWDQLPGKPLIEEGYPLLREGGRRLAKQGVRFHDLSMAFAKSKEPFYFDNCCHFNRAGNEVLARAVARAVLETREPPRAPETTTSLKPAAPGR
jgi:lysophospholipase L1-like esterase